MRKTNKKFLKKYMYFLLIGLVLFVTFIANGCGENIEYTPPTPDEVENFQKISGSHTIVDEDVSSYILIKNRPYKDELLYSMENHYEQEWMELLGPSLLLGLRNQGFCHTF